MEKQQNLLNETEIFIFKISLALFLILITKTQINFVQDLAVKAAKKAFERGSEWRNLDASARGLLMNK